MSNYRHKAPDAGPDRNWCDPCNKRDLRTRKAALGEASRVRAHEGQVVTHYKCSHGAWHIGHPITHEAWLATMERMQT